MTTLGPYELNQIYCGECAAMMERLPDACIDLTVTSPPYDNLRLYTGYTFDFEPIARQLYRVTKPGGVVVWVVGDATENGSESLTSFRQALYFRELGFNVETMIYEVAGTGAKGSHYYYWQSFEYMLVLAKEQPKTVNRIADKANARAGILVTRGNKTNLVGTRLGEYRVNNTGIRTNVWRYHAGNNGNDQTDHPAPFPEALARDHIISWSNPGDVVLDPMAGSGTTLKMAHILERQWLGFDISEEYCQLARRRVGEVIREHNKEWKPLTGNGHKIDDLPLFAPQPVEAAT